MQRGSQYSILRVQCSTVRRYWSYIVVRAKPFTIQRGERLVVGVQPKADDRALDGSTFTTLCTHCSRRTYVTYSEKMKRLQTCEQRQRSSKQKHTANNSSNQHTTKSETITLALWEGFFSLLALVGFLYQARFTGSENNWS